MSRGRLTATLIAAVLVLPVALVADTADAAKRPSPAAKKLRLASFDDCGELVRYARRHAPRVESYYGLRPPAPGPTTMPPATSGTEGGGGQTDTATPAPAPTAGDSSSTNVQEQGVDEPDIVKNDGKTIFAIENGSLHAVDARSSEPKLLDSLELDGYGHQLLVHGRRALVIGYAVSALRTGGAATTPDYGYYRPATSLTEVDVSDPADLKVIRSETVDGSFVSARLSGDTARVVLTTPPAALFAGVEDSADRRLDGWVPSSTLVDKRSGASRTRRIVRCRAVRHPRTFAGLDLLTVLTVDMSRGLPAVDADSLMTTGEDVYASTSGLYVATHRWTPPPASPDQVPPAGRTVIHRFDASDPARTVYKASGEVPGYVLSQWSLSEYKGVLRVASTQAPEWWDGGQRAESESYITTLAERDGALVELGRVGGIGRGEQIFGVRMIDDTGYVVTFRQTDPLYTVDLSTPTAPKVLGELKILGYSAYLHPLGGDLLLGVGQDATEQGRSLGTQLSIFDVSDPHNPRRLHRRRLARNSSSDAEWDHHAFLYWAPRKLAVLPVREYDDPPFLGAVGFQLDRDAGISPVGRIAHDWAGRYFGAIERSVVVGDRIFTVSPLGVKASDLGTFADRGRVELTQPSQTDAPAPPGGGVVPAR